MVIPLPRRRFAVLAAGMLAGSAITLAGPASAAQVQPADVVCNLTSNAYLFVSMSHAGGSGAQFTLHKGRGFHSYEHYYFDDDHRNWVYGYGAEHPDVDGWILLSHAPTC